MTDAMRFLAAVNETRLFAILSLISAVSMVVSFVKDSTRSVKIISGCCFLSLLFVTMVTMWRDQDALIKANRAEIQGLNQSNAVRQQRIDELQNLKIVAMAQQPRQSQPEPPARQPQTVPAVRPAPLEGWTLRT